GLRGHCHRIAPVCHQCFEDHVKGWWGIKSVGVYSTSKCENCSRTVNEAYRPRRKHRYYCCEDCRQKHAPRLYAEKARQAKAQRAPRPLPKIEFSTFIFDGLGCGSDRACKVVFTLCRTRSPYIGIHVSLHGNSRSRWCAR